MGPDLLRGARRARGLTQGEVAERVDMSTEAYGRLERGGVMPRAETLRRLAVALSVSADLLLGLPADVDPGPKPEPHTPGLRRLLRVGARLSLQQLRLVAQLAEGLGGADADDDDDDANDANDADANDAAADDADDDADDAPIIFPLRRMRAGAMELLVVSGGEQENEQVGSSTPPGGQLRTDSLRLNPAALVQLGCHRVKVMGTLHRDGSRSVDVRGAPPGAEISIRGDGGEAALGIADAEGAVDILVPASWRAATVVAELALRSGQARETTVAFPRGQRS